MSRFVIGCLVIGCLLRLWIVLAGIGYDTTLSFFDARDYHAHAVNLLGGKGFTNGKAWASRPPVYPFLLAFFYRFFGVSFIPVRIFQCVLSTLTIFLVYQIGRRFFQTTALRLGVALCTVHPILILYCGNILTETTACFLLALLSWLLLRLDPSSRRRSFFLAGVLFGILLLTKSSLFLLFPFLIGWFWARKIPGRALSLFCIGVVLVLAPWSFRNARVLGEPVVLTTNGGTTFWDANNPRVLEDPSRLGLPAEWIMPGRVTVERDGEIVQLREAQGDHLLWKKGFQFLRSLLAENPKRFGWLFFRKFLAAFSLHTGKAAWEMIGYGLLYTFAFWGIWLSRRASPRPTLLWLIVVQYIVASLIFWGRAKYRVVIEPYLMLFVGVFGVWALDRFRRVRDR